MLRTGVRPIRHAGGGNERRGLVLRGPKDGGYGAGDTEHREENGADRRAAGRARPGAGGLADARLRDEHALFDEVLLERGAEVIGCLEALSDVALEGHEQDLRKALR